MQSTREPTRPSPSPSTAAAGAATCPWYPTATNSISQNKFPGASYLNWSAQYQIGGTPLKDFQVYAKVDNVLDKDPPDFAYVAFDAVNINSSTILSLLPGVVRGVLQWGN